jgi:hypothetical protein
MDLEMHPTGEGVTLWRNREAWLYSSHLVDLADWQ